MDYCSTQEPGDRWLEKFTGSKHFSTSKSSFQHLSKEKIMLSQIVLLFLPCPLTSFVEGTPTGQVATWVE
jgi:hypothetical protein